MRQVNLHGIEDLRVDEAAMPEPGPRDIVLKVEDILAYDVDSLVDIDYLERDVIANRGKAGAFCLILRQFGSGGGHLCPKVEKRNVHPDATGVDFRPGRTEIVDMDGRSRESYGRI